jgi:plastocyanin
MASSRAATRSAVLLLGWITVVINGCAGAVPATGSVGTHGSGAASASPSSAVALGSGGPAVSGSPAESGGPTGDVTVVAEDGSFTTDHLSAPAGKAFTIRFQNKDPYVLHDVDVMNAAGSKIIFDGQLVFGPKDITYDVPALPAGTYQFRCSVHPGQMSGTLTAS